MYIYVEKSKKYMKGNFFVLKVLIAFISISAFANLHLDFQMVYKKNILNDKSFLKSEIQEVLDFSEKDTVNIYHRNLRVEVITKLNGIPFQDEFGPSSIVDTKVNIYKKSQNGETLMNQSHMLMQLGQEAEFQVGENNESLLDIKLKGYF